MASNVDEDLLALREGQAASNLLEVLGSTLSDLDASVDARIMGRLASGETLTPQEALQAWLEKYGYHRIRKKLERTSRVGRRAAAALGEQFKF